MAPEPWQLLTLKLEGGLYIKQQLHHPGQPCPRCKAKLRLDVEDRAAYCLMCGFRDGGQDSIGHMESSHRELVERPHSIGGTWQTADQRMRRNYWESP